MRTDFTVSTKHQFWKIFQRLEQMVEPWGMSAAKFEARKETLSNVKGEPEKNCAESSHNPACAAAAEQQLRIENGLTRLKTSHRGRIPLHLVQEIKDNALQLFTHYKLYRLGYGLRLKPLAEVAEFLQSAEELQTFPIAEK
jgi:hypothetical protein